jgi:hypothetical protein
MVEFEDLGVRLSAIGAGSRPEIFGQEDPRNLPPFPAGRADLPPVLLGATSEIPPEAISAPPLIAGRVPVKARQR